MNESRPLIRASSAAFLSLLIPIAARAASGVVISKAQRDGNGFLVHSVASPYQSGTTAIRVLLPDAPQGENHLTALYILPVEAGNGRHWGDGHRLGGRIRMAFTAF